MVLRLINGGNITIKNPIAREALDWFLHIGIAVIIGVLIVTFVAQRTIVYGSSMEPTLQDNNQLVIEKITPRFGKLKYGDIVTIYVPEELSEGKDYIIKRVIGVAGDTIEVKDGKVYLNGKKLDEPYMNGNYTYEVDPQYSSIKVPDGMIYVLGDNRLRNASKDSRSIGPVAIGKVRGRAFVRLYPFNKIRTF
jgi:signal peptidase I